MNTPNNHVDYDKILRAVRQEFRVIELRELLNEYGYGAYRSTQKAQLQSRVEELLKSDKRSQVVRSIQQISKRLNGILSKALPADMARAGGSHYVPHQYQQQAHSMVRQPPFGAGALQPFNPFGANSSRVKLIPLPFYDIKHVLLTPTVLSPNYRSDPTSMCAHYVFTIPPHSEYGALSYRESDALPRYEIQMRMALCEYDKEQPDGYPNNIKVTINRTLITLPPLLNVQPQPGQPRSDQQKRQSRPVNLTPYCNPRDSTYQLSVEWQDRNFFMIGIWLVYHVTPLMLRDRLKTSGPHLYEETRMMIKKYLGGGHAEDEIAMDSLKISLICPLSRIKMSTPVRSKDCTHLQCFDLQNYLLMNEKRPSWKCPVCNKSCSFESLAIDRYFSEIIGVVDGSVNEVELLPNGDWKIYEEKKKPPSVVRSDTFAGRASTSKPGSIDSSNGASTSTKPPQSVPDIITLDDSDEDVPVNVPSVSSSSSNVPESRKRTHDQAAQYSSSSGVTKTQDYTVITLDDDSDVDETPVVRRPTTADPANAVKTNDQRPFNSMPLGSKQFENKCEDTFSSLDTSTVLQLSQALIDFMRKLEADNTNCQ